MIREYIVCFTWCFSVGGAVLQCLCVGGCNYNQLCSLKNCEKRNMALGRPATVSSLFNNAGYNEISGPPCLAVNGNTNTAFRPINQFPDSPNCVHTADEKNPSYWWVDLGQPYDIDSITVYGRDRWEGALVHTTVSVDNRIHFTFNSSFTIKTDISFAQPVKGQIVKLQRENGFLVLCEVQVWTCNFGFYGRDCQMKCGKCKIGDTCDTVNGSCPSGCQPGYKSQYCNMSCTAGRYGDGCNSVCGNCKNTRECNTTTGSCTDGCDSGWKGDRCDQYCEVGKYGKNCNRNCSNCGGDGSCDMSTGICTSGCSDGWTSDNCSLRCPSTVYGKDCGETCGKCRGNTTCRHTDGRCEQGCAVDFFGDLCKSPITSSQTATVLIAGVVSACFLVLIVVILFIILLIRWLRRPRHQQQYRQRYSPGDSRSTCDTSIPARSTTTTVEAHSTTQEISLGVEATWETGSLYDTLNYDDNVEKDYTALSLGMIRANKPASRDYVNAAVRH